MSINSDFQRMFRVAQRQAELVRFIEQKVLKTDNKKVKLNDEIQKSFLQNIVRQGIESIESELPKFEWFKASKATLALFCLCQYLNPRNLSSNDFEFRKHKASKSALFNLSKEFLLRLDSGSIKYVQFEDLRLLSVSSNKLNLSSFSSSILGGESKTSGKPLPVSAKSEVPGYLAIAISQLRETLERGQSKELQKISSPEKLFEFIVKICGGLKPDYDEFTSIMAMLSDRSYPMEFLSGYVIKLIEKDISGNKSDLLAWWSNMQAIIKAKGEAKEKIDLASLGLACPRFTEVAGWGQDIAECNLCLADIRGLPDYSAVIDSAIESVFLDWPLTSDYDREVVIDFITAELFTNVFMTAWMEKRK